MVASKAHSLLDNLIQSIFVLQLPTERGLLEVG